jgi:hypothetical protein
MPPSRRASRWQNARPANRLAGPKTASRKFFSRPSILRPELLPQVTETHQESLTYVFVFVSGCVVAPNNAGNPNWTAQDRLAAGYAKAVYGQDGVTGGLLKQMGIPYNPKDGFAAALYQGPDGKYYLAMRGTEPLTWADWKANLTQGLNISASQYNQANSLATMVYFALGGTGNAGGAPSNFVLVGHSLGGGLASAAANNTGVNAITFNAAGLSEQYNNGYLSGDIRAHYIRGEILSTAQDYSPMYNAVGTRISHPAPHWYTDPVSRHLMSSFDGL